MTGDLLLVSGSSQVRTPAGLNHAVYAARHGLRYVFDMTPVPVRLIYLNKIEIIRRHLPLADWVFWIDDDAFFTNLSTDLRSFLPVEPGVELVVCGSPVNPEGGWTWISSGQLLVRNTPRMLALLDAVLATDLASVRAWWDPETLGMFTRGDQDLLVYQLRRDDSPWADAWQVLPWQAFNSRPYHYAESLDEHFVCHFAVPGGRPKMDLVRDFAARLGTTTALVAEAELAAYRTFIARSDLAPLLSDPTGVPGVTRAPTASGAKGGGLGDRLRRGLRAVGRSVRGSPRAGRG